MGLTLLSAPAKEPVGIDEARAVCRLLHDGADLIVLPLIQAGRERCERVSGRALVGQQWLLTLPGWPYDSGSVGSGLATRSQVRYLDNVQGGGRAVGGPIIRLPRPPLLTVDSVKYVAATDGALTVLAADQYLVDATAEPGTITPAYGKTWPTVRCQQAAVQVTFTAGYGTDPASVPAEIRERIKNYVAYCFERPVERDERWLDTLFEGFFCGEYT